MKLHIYTQDQENYGAHDWDGEGECPQYWKFKGGEDFFVPMGNRINSETATAIVLAVRADIEEDSNYFRRQIIGWDIVVLAVLLLLLDTLLLLLTVLLLLLAMSYLLFALLLLLLALLLLLTILKGV